MSALQCRACGSAAVSFRGRKTGEFIRREFAFHACRDCGLLFVEPFSGFAIYDDAYYRGHGPDPYVDYAAEYRDWRDSDRLLEFADMLRIAEERLREQETKIRRDHEAAGLRGYETTRRPDSQTARPPVHELPPPSEPLFPSLGSPVVPSSCSPGGAERLRWLDFGCGAGAFLQCLRERGTLHGRPLELTGHDVGSYANLLKAQDGFRILDLTELSHEPAASFDVISMIEVLEHLPSPLEALQLIARLLKPGGLLLLTTGNLDSPVARRQGIHYRYCAPEIHVSLFQPRTLARLYRRVGLEPLPVRYHGAVRFKVLKTLRHRPLLRTLARLALCLPPTVRLIDWLYGVSAMPCATKPPIHHHRPALPAANPIPTV